MHIFKYLAFAAIAVGAIAMAGCSGSKPAPTTPPDSTASALPIDKDDKGQIICPVTGSVVSSPEAAAGFQDWNGKRYYFCCGACPDKFKADPEKYAVRHEIEPM